MFSFGWHCLPLDEESTELAAACPIEKAFPDATVSDVNEIAGRLNGGTSVTPMSLRRAVLCAIIFGFHTGELNLERFLCVAGVNAERSPRLSAPGGRSFYFRFQNDVIFFDSCLPKLSAQAIKLYLRL